MEQITVIKKDKTTFDLFSKTYGRTVNQAIQDISLMGDDTVTLTVLSSTLIDFGIGDKITVGSKEYFIRTMPSREIISDDLFIYEVKFYGVIYELIKSQYRDTNTNGLSKRSTFDLTYGIKDFVKVVINNISRDYPNWMFDESNCPDTEPKTLTFSKQNCLQALQRICSEFNYDFIIEQSSGIRTIKVGKFGTTVTPPGGKSHFEWGKGGGLFSLREKKVDDKAIITRLWVEGGTNNLRAGYRNFSDRLQIPYPARTNIRPHILYDGTLIAANSMQIGTSDDTKRYIEDSALRDKIGSIEDTEYFDSIFPQRTGTVTSIGDDELSFVDNEMDFDLNETDALGNTKYLISGVSAKINFITGKLAGMQFELQSYEHKTSTFKLIRYTDERGVSFPTPDSDAFRFEVGNKYKITDINLPDSYVKNAEEDLWFAGYNKLLQRKQPMAQYELLFDESYFETHLSTNSDVTVFVPGDYVPIKDERFGIEKNIRIQHVKRNLLKKYDYSLTLSDTTTISIFSQTVIDVLEHNTVIERNKLRDINKARLGWRTTEELRNLVYDSDGYFDIDNIRPNSIDTNMLTVGSRSQQYILIDTVMQANKLGNPNMFYVSAGKLIHFTISDELRTWNMSELNDLILSDSGAYYVYAKCAKIGDTGIYYVTKEQLRVENTDPNNYYFQVGIIGSLDVVSNFRDFITTYGFTRINGNSIVTGKIKSADGDTYFDLDNGIIGGKIVFQSGSSGLDNLNEWNVAQSNISKAQKTATEANNAIKDLEIGGVNLIRNGDFYDELNEWNINSPIETLPEVLVIYKGIDLPEGSLSCLRVSATTGGQGVWQNFKYNNKLELNRTYTLSFLLKKSGSEKFELYFGHEENIETREIIKIDAWERHIYRFTPTTHQNIVFYANNAGVFFITNVQLEKSTMPSNFKSGYLERALKQTSEINGGLVLGSIIAARNLKGEVKSYISGIDENQTAIAAGVYHFNTPDEIKSIDLRHDGSGHIAMGCLKWDEFGNLIFGSKTVSDVIEIKTTEILTSEEVVNKEYHEVDAPKIHKTKNVDDPSQQPPEIHLSYEREFEIKHNANFHIDILIGAGQNGNNESFGVDGGIILENLTTGQTLEHISFVTGDVAELTTDTNLIYPPGKYKVSVGLSCGVTEATAPGQTINAYINAYIAFQYVIKKIIIGNDGIVMYDTKSDNMIRLSLSDKVIESIGNVQLLSPNKYFGLEINDSGARIMKNKIWYPL